MEEIFLQNGLTLPDNLENAIRTILCGNTLTAYESHVQERQEHPEDQGHPRPLSEDVGTVETTVSSLGHRVYKTTTKG